MSDPNSRVDKGKSTTAVPPRGKKKGQPGSARPPVNRPGPQLKRSSQADWEARRRRNRWIAGGAVALVVVVIAALVAVKLAGGGSSSGPPREPLPASDATTLTGVPLTTVLQAGAKQSVIWPGAISQTPLTAGGKPEMLYIGAEYCPVCATQRWPMVVALSHFGTFSNLAKTHSSVTDGNIPTVSFYGSTFTSSYLTFTPVETTTNQPSGNFYKPLETPTPAQQAVWAANSPGGQLSFPFIDIGGKWLLQTSQFSPTLLEGKSFNQIMASVGNNNTAVGANIDASAAVLIRKICTVTGEKPAATCTASSAAQLAAPSQTSGVSSPSQ